MQKLPVYLYTNLFEVTLDLDDNIGIHQTMYQRPLKIQKGVRNTVQLQFKNSDQKRINISTKEFVMNVFDETTHNLVMTKNVAILDDGSTSTYAVLRGLGEVTFSEGDTLDIDAKTYKFSIVKLEDDDSYSPAYSNTYYDVSGTIEVKNDAYPTPKQSVEITNFQRTFNSDISKRWWEWYSGNIRAYPELKSNNALHTVGFYLTGYRGRVIVEGTLENSPGFYGNYAIISEKLYSTRFTGIDYANFNGVFTNIRIRYIPAVNPLDLQNTDTSYTGTFDKLLYRS
jgi:hypothetical protein